MRLGRFVSRLDQRDRGAGAIEYAGVVVLAGAVIAVLVSTGVLQRVLPDKVDRAVCTISGGGCDDAGVQAVSAHGGEPDSGEGAQPGGGESEEGVSPDRRDSERDARGDRRDGGRGDETQPNDGTSGAPEPDEGSSYGAPVAGTSVPEPAPPAWQPVDEGSGEHDSVGAGIRDRAVEFAAETGANAVSGVWPNASRNLLHYLGNSGETIDQDVEQVLGDVPEFAGTVDANRVDLGIRAVERARELGLTGPTTFPVNTSWVGYGYSKLGQLVYDNQDWFYAMGGWEYNHTGQVTVYPPDTAGGAWRYEVSTRVNLRDQYNWDKGKGVTIGPLEVTDEELAKLHRAGLAQEYTIIGRSDVASREGSVP